MSKANSTARKLKSQPSQPKTRQTHEEWHESRYGDLRDKLSTEQLKQLVEDVCGKNYDEQAAAALILLMDELERSQFDRMAIQNIALTVSKAAFPYTETHNKAEESLALAMRKRYAALEVCHA